MSARSQNIVVFSGDYSYSVRKGLIAINQAIPDLNWLLLLHKPPRTPALLLQSQLRNLKRNGWRWIPYQAQDTLERLLPRRTSPGRADAPGSEFTFGSLSEHANMRLVTVDDIHATPTLESVRAFQPDLGLSLAAPILKPALFTIPRLGTLNLHKGKVPEYRGMPPAFWELWHNESSVGCTVHRVERKLDTGAILAEGVVQREPFSDVRGLQLCLDELGVELMRGTVQRVLAGTALERAQPTGGQTFRKPTLRQVSQLDRKLRAVPLKMPMAVRVAKRGLYAGAFGLTKIGAIRTLAPRITVLLYHRVSDSVRDNLTVGVAQFDRQIALLRANCQVLSIEEVVSVDRVSPAPKPMVCVTFDDGYLDNYTNAAPILQRHGVPAAFFVSTGIIDTSSSFPHDILRGNAPIPVMRWEQLRLMKKNGFSIGSHSVSHIDCAAEPEEKVRSELLQSREQLASELGQQQMIFAYPYGGRQHMTNARLALVKESGYSGCLSAYGGTNIGNVDRFNVLRRGINWEFSDRAFLYQCLGL